MLRASFAVVILNVLMAGTLLSQPPAEANKPGELPKVVLIGDSLRLSYASVVATQLQGKAVVISPKENGGDSNSVSAHLEKWAIQAQPDIVHFNCGIHDTKKYKATGKFQVSPEEYEANLRDIVQRLRKDTHAVVVFATTTPILDDRAAAAREGREYELLESSVEQYNAIAKKVMAELKVPVNDLHAALAKPSPPHSVKTLLGIDGVHLTNDGKTILGQQVAQFLGEVLSQEPK